MLVSVFYDGDGHGLWRRLWRLMHTYVAQWTANQYAVTLKKDGTFTGSFKVYYIAGGKLKTVTVNVSGVVINGVGYGAATVKKISGSVAVSIK